MAELYLAGADRARADEIVRYARSRLGEDAMRATSWAALRRAVRAPRRPGRAAAAAPAEDPDLASARAALAAAQLIQSTSAPKGATP